jgi:biofilm PGA synthesis N-glycosyltransferase PgaC
MFVIWLNYVVSIVWAYVLVLGFMFWIVDELLIDLGETVPIVGSIPAAWGAILASTYFLQATVSVLIDRRFEPGIWRSLFWIVWFPLAFWLIQAFTAVLGLPKAVLRRSGQRGVWKSPDRGFR